MTIRYKSQSGEPSVIHWQALMKEYAEANEAQRNTIWAFINMIAYPHNEVTGETREVLEKLGEPLGEWQDWHDIYEIWRTAANRQKYGDRMRYHEEDDAHIEKQL